MSHVRALASAALLFFAATANRVEVELHGAFHNTAENVTACEDDSIWEAIMVNPDVGSIRVIPWKEIMDKIQNYLEIEARMISNLEQETQNLQMEIDSKKAAAVSKVLSDEQIQELVTGSVSAEGSYGSVETAKLTACGKPGKRPRVPSTAMEVATDSVVPLAKPLLSEGMFKSSVGKFTNTCKTFLDAGDDEIENYCGEVCKQLAGVVQGLSDQHSNSVKDTALLEKALAAKKLALLEARKREGTCIQSKENTLGFQTYLESLDADIARRHTAVRKAELDLDNAQWALDDLQEKLATQQQLVSDAATLLTGSQAVVKEAREALVLAQKDEGDLIQQIGNAKNLVAQLRDELDNMNKASDAVLEIKKYVSATAWKMAHYFDVTVREPVRKIGLNEEKNMSDYFSENVSTEECSANFKKELTDFHQYCTGTAMAGFEKMKQYIDLTPICTLDEESQIAMEEDTAVQTRISLLMRALRNVQSWLDPFKGMPYTSEREQTMIDLGEPEGLRHVMAVYGRIHFYRDYLKNWKANDGWFHELLKQLTENKKVLDDKLLKQDTVLQQLKDRLTVASNSRVQAKGKLDVALADEQAVVGDKENLEKVKASLEAQILGAKNLLTDLEALLKHAVQLYKEARTTLVSGYEEGKDGILALGQVHEAVLND